MLTFTKTGNLIKAGLALFLLVTTCNAAQVGDSVTVSLTPQIRDDNDEPHIKDLIKGKEITGKYVSYEKNLKITTINIGSDEKPIFLYVSGDGSLRFAPKGAGISVGAPPAKRKRSVPKKGDCVTVTITKKLRGQQTKSKILQNQYVTEVRGTVLHVDRDFVRVNIQSTCGMDGKYDNCTEPEEEKIYVANGDIKSINRRRLATAARLDLYSRNGGRAPVHSRRRRRLYA